MDKYGQLFKGKLRFSNTKLMLGLKRQSLHLCTNEKNTQIDLGKGLLSEVALLIAKGQLLYRKNTLKLN